METYRRWRVLLDFVVRIINRVIIARIIRGPATSLFVHDDEQVEARGGGDALPVVLDEADEFICYLRPMSVRK